MAINANVYVNGFGGSSGDDLVLDEPWYTGGTVAYVDSVNGSDSDSGFSRAQPKKTLAAGVTAAGGSGGFVVLMAGFSEVLTSVQTVGTGVTIVGEGLSGGQPTATIGMNSSSAIALDITGNHVEIRGIKFTTNAQANAASKIRIGTVTDCLIKGCRFEASATDTGSLVTLTDGARTSIVDTTLVAVGTTGSAGFGMSLDGATLSNLTMSDVVFDGGTQGWAAGICFVGVACTISVAVFEGVSLVRGSSMLVKSASSGRLNVTSNDSSRVSFV